MSKPKTIRVSTQGIEAKPITMNEPAPVIDWHELSALPPFQMYMCERVGEVPQVTDMARWALNKSQEAMLTMNSSELFSDYASWHKAKGYWPNETPLGENNNDFRD